MSEFNREHFAQEVIERVRARFPLARIARAAEPFSVRLNGHVASLENLYRTVAINPQQIDRHVDRWAVELLRAAEGAPDRDAGFDELSSRILPIVMNGASYQASKSVTLSQPLLEDLAVGYVLDGDRTIAHIPRNQLEKWNVTLDEVHQRAIDNLSARSAELRADAAQDGTGTINVILFHAGDGYDSSRILLPNLHERLREHLGSPFVAAVPNRDILICVRNAAPVLKSIRGQVKQDFLTMPHQVSERLFLVTADGLAPMDAI
jgi:uncharacterized protein YtpQ (UPF0354 family)